jgi:hypothetical protein
LARVSMGFGVLGGFSGEIAGFCGVGALGAAAAAAEVAGQFASDGRRGYAWGETWRPGWEAGRRLPGPRGRIGWGGKPEKPPAVPAARDHGRRGVKIVVGNLAAAGRCQAAEGGWLVAAGDRW